MKANQTKGNLDILLLGVLSAGPGHGYEIIAALRDRSAGEFDLPEGTVYPSLHRLERDGLLSSAWETAGASSTDLLLDGGGGGIVGSRAAELEAVLPRDERGAGDARMSSAESIDDYLDDLAGRLGGSAQQSRRFLVEVEAHLHDERDAGIARGEDPADAESEALRRFGTPEEVARASNRTTWRASRRSVARAAISLALRLVAIGMIVIGVAGVATRVISNFGLVSAMYGLPSDVVMTADHCAHWLAVQPTATTCQQAGTLEASDDSTGIYLVVGVLGLLLALPLLVIWRRSGRGVLPPSLGPGLSAAMFGSAAAGLLALGVSNAVIFTTWGRGMWLTDAACAFLACVVSVVLVVRALQHMSGTGAQRRSILS